MGNVIRSCATDRWRSVSHININQLDCCAMGGAAESGLNLDQLDTGTIDCLAGHQWALSRPILGKSRI
jgi:hypothetical protein